MKKTTRARSIALLLSLLLSLGCLAGVQSPAAAAPTTSVSINGIKVSAVKSGTTAIITPTDAQWLSLANKAGKVSLKSFEPEDYLYYPSTDYVTYINIADTTIDTIELHYVGSEALRYTDLCIAQSLVCFNRPEMGYVLYPDFTGFATGHEQVMTIAAKQGRMSIALTFDGSTDDILYNHGFGLDTVVGVLAPDALLDADDVYLEEVLANGRRARINRSFALMFVAGYISHNGTYEAAGSSPVNFVDVPSWAKAEIDYLNVRNIANGTGGNKFGASANVKRCDFVKLLMSAIGYSDYALPSLQAAKKQFSDVAANSYYAKSVLKARQLGIVDGSGGNKFNPDSYISRQDMACMIDRAANIFGFENRCIFYDADDKTCESFKDWQTVSGYAQTSMNKMVQNGIIVGSKGLLKPRGNATRAEAGVVLARLLYLDVFAYLFNYYPHLLELDPEDLATPQTNNSALLLPTEDALVAAQDFIAQAQPDALVTTDTPSGDA